MSQIKVILVEIRDPQNWKGTHVITSNGVVEFHGSDGAAHIVTNSNDKKEMKSFGTLYQMVGYNPNANEEEDQFLPIAIDQWKLSTKFIPRNGGFLVYGLSNYGKLHKHEFQPAIWTEDGYKLFKAIDVNKT